MNFLSDYLIASNSKYLLFFLIAWAISYISFPVIINISKAKGLTAVPTGRSSHKAEIPNLGGVGIFIGFVLAFSSFGSMFGISANYNVSGCLVILLFLGLKDDILILTARTKFLVQIGIGLIMSLSSTALLNNMYGVFDLYQIGLLPAVLLTTFAYVLIINSYNLIDGIDGLAGTIAICVLFVSSIIFYNANVMKLFVASLALMGSLVAFLQYNFSNKKKLFMGDTGTMIVGFLLCFLVINILSIKNVDFGLFSYQVSPALVVALLFYPLMDTARIFFIRLFILKRSPFKADKNHIHHRLLSIGFKHYQISIFVGIVTLAIAIFSVSLADFNIYEQLLFVISFGVILLSVPFIFHKASSLNFNFIKKTILSVTIIVALTFMQSCASKRDLLYLGDNAIDKISDEKIKNQSIEVNDILSIKIYSLDPESSKIYNIDLLEGSAGQGVGLELAKLKGYLVSDVAAIVMPVLGTVEVGNKTTAELEAYLRYRLINEGHLKDPTVVVRILNSKVTVLGEVRTPGTFTFSEKNLTIFQALGLAGDLTINGERRDVVVVRQDRDSKKIYHIDLTSKNWMSTELYYIKQNDVIIVNPNTAKIKSSGIIGNPSTLVSIVSFLLTGFLLIKK